jgi:2-methylcitrate dehydratase PrpD
MSLQTETTAPDPLQSELPDGGLTDRVADFIVGTQLSDLPEKVRSLSIPALVDTLGVIVAGRSGDAGQAMLRWAERVAQSSTAPRRWSGLPAGLSAGDEALVTSTMGHALDFDDVSGVGHPSSILLSAILAAGRGEKISGARLLEAYAVGYEVSVKVSRATGHRHYRHGWHTTSTAGVFGGVAAVCKLRGLDARRTRVAMGIAGSLASGLQRNFGSMTKPLHSGLTARNSVLAVELAEVDFTASTDILDGPRGFLGVYGVGDAQPEHIAELGEPWAMEERSATLKKYPCCYSTHRPIDAVLALQAEHDIAPEDVERIVVRAPTFALVPLIHHRPTTGLQGKFSAEYTIAAALLDRRIGLGSFTAEQVQRDEIRRIIELIDVAEDPANRPEDPTAVRSTAGVGGFWDVSIIRRGGETVSASVHYPSGSPEKPLTWDETHDKFVDCLAIAQVPAAESERILDSLRALEGVGDVTVLLDDIAAHSG